MFLRIVFLSFILFVSSFLFGQTTDLLISEYGEGSSWNSKYIEIYNGTGATVSLANYRLCMISNGGAWCESNYSFTTANIVDGATLVIANNSGDVPGADEYTGSISWNGDDAVSLQKNSAGWVLLDVIGTDGADPGTGWDVAGTTNATKDNVLTRKAAICGPNTDWDNSRGTNTTNSEWVVTSYTTGSANAGHTSSCASCSPDTEPTLNSTTMIFSNIGCNSIDISWSSGNGSNRIVVASTSTIVGTPTDQTNYSSNAAFGSGDIISAGEFVVYNGTGNSFSVTSLNSNTIYYFAVFEYNGVASNCTENYFTSTPLSGSETTSTCTNAEITGILVDACGGNEGLDELFTFTNGTSSMALNDFSVDFPNGETYCNSGCATRTWVTNPTFVTQLNDTAGCAGLFIEADPIPANASVIVFTGSNPTHDFDFSGLCGTGPYYAIFANNTNTGGRFGNYNGDCSQYRTLTVDFGGGYTDDVTYQRCSLSNTDGDFVSFDDAGNATYGNDGCTPSSLLPIELLFFNGKKKNTFENLLEWATTTEINNDYFTLERAEDGFNFIEIGVINGAGNSSTNQYYQFTDDGITNHINYYRLKQTDFNGQYSYSHTIAISSDLSNMVYYNTNAKRLEIGDIENGIVSIYTLQGQIVKSLQTKNNSVSLNISKGMYLITIQTESQVFSKKIIVR